jgi:hypothetical protein
MAKKARIPEKLKPWIEARRRYSLSHAHIQMARDLGFNPKKLGSKANHDQEPWKAPLPVYIEELYLKRFGRELPERVRSIEQIAADQRAKKEAKRAAKAARQAADSKE